MGCFPVRMPPTAFFPQEISSLSMIFVKHINVGITLMSGADTQLDTLAATPIPTSPEESQLSSPVVSLGKMATVTKDC